jgi:flagellum-specific peptidoglycan hydrolase FlgJ
MLNTLQQPSPNQINPNGQPLLQPGGQGGMPQAIPKIPIPGQNPPMPAMAPQRPSMPNPGSPQPPLLPTSGAGAPYPINGGRPLPGQIPTSVSKGQLGQRVPPPMPGMMQRPMGGNPNPQQLQAQQMTTSQLGNQQNPNGIPGGPALGWRPRTNKQIDDQINQYLQHDSIQNLMQNNPYFKKLYDNLPQTGQANLLNAGYTFSQSDKMKSQQGNGQAGQANSPQISQQQGAGGQQSPQAVAPNMGQQQAPQLQGQTVQPGTMNGLVGQTIKPGQSFVPTVMPVNTINKLSPQFQPQVINTMQNMQRLGYYPTIASGLRTPEEQAKLVQQGNSHTMNSAHLTGNAADLVDARYQWNGSPQQKQYANDLINVVGQNPNLVSGGKWKSFGPQGDWDHVQMANYQNQQRGGNMATPQELSIPNIVAQAKAAYPHNPVLAQLTATQAVLESGLNGHPSQLASKYNNLFGIKGNGTNGSVNLPTHEYINGRTVRVNANFAHNNSIADSFTQHQKLLSNSRYKNVAAAKSFPEAAQAIKDAGYATDKNYPSLLQNTYNSVIAPHW